MDHTLDDFVKYLCNHLIVFETKVKKEGKEIDDFCICSGTIIKIINKNLILTAGHCVDDFIDLIYKEKNYNYEFKTSLIDCLGSDAEVKSIIPFTECIRDNYKWRIDSHGLDIGLIELNSNNLRLLMSNNLKATDLSHALTYTNNYDLYISIGQPKSLVKNSRGFSVPGLWSEKLNEEETPEYVNKDNIFKNYIGKLYENMDLSCMDNNIKGISGGPIMGIDLKASGPVYYVFGVNSSWYKHKKEIITGSLLSEFSKLFYSTVLDRLGLREHELLKNIDIDAELDIIEKYKKYSYLIPNSLIEFILT